MKAKGVTGFLLKTFDHEKQHFKFVFRVYGDNDDFEDFDINHYDLEVTIVDDDAHFINGRIDYED